MRGAKQLALGFETDTEGRVSVKDSNDVHQMYVQFGLGVFRCASSIHQTMVQRSAITCSSTGIIVGNESPYLNGIGLEVGSFLCTETIHEGKPHFL